MRQARDLPAAASVGEEPHAQPMGGAGDLPGMVRRLGFVSLVFALAACGAPAATPTEPARDKEAEFVTLLNQRRDEAGCLAVTMDERLAQAARRHAADMRDHSVRDHTGSDGSTAVERVADAGFTPASATGEILYWSEADSDARSAVAAWMDSPAHREIIRTCRFTHVGVGVIDGSGYIAVADFAAH